MAVRWVKYNYFNDSLSRFAREAPFNLLLISVTLGLWGGLVILSHLPKGGLLNYVIAIFAIVSMIPFVMFIKRHLLGYPDEIKPQWLLEEECKHDSKDDG